MAGKVKMLQAWLKQQCQGYRDVEVRDMSKSWKSGLAFCAIIHKYRPDLIDYDSLSKENVYENNKLAFETAHKELGIPALLDAEDMVAMAVPDKLCIITYVSQYYNYFRDKDPKGGPGVSSKRAPKRAPASSTASPQPERKKVAGDDTDMEGEKRLKRQGTYGETCLLCNKKVYLLERHIDNGRLFHRRCFHSSQRGSSMSPRSSSSSIDDIYKANISPAGSQPSSPYLARSPASYTSKSITDVLKEKKGNSNKWNTQNGQSQSVNQNGRSQSKPYTRSPLASEPVSDNTRSAQKSWQILNRLDSEDSPMREAKSGGPKSDLTPAKYTSSAMPWQASDATGQESLIQISQKPWQPVGVEKSSVQQISSSSLSSAINPKSGSTDVNMQPSKNFPSSMKTETFSDKDTESKNSAAREGLSKLLGKEMGKESSKPHVEHMVTDCDVKSKDMDDQKNLKKASGPPRSILKRTSQDVRVSEPRQKDVQPVLSHVNQTVINEKWTVPMGRSLVNGVSQGPSKWGDGSYQKHTEKEMCLSSVPKGHNSQKPTESVHRLQNPAKSDHGMNSQKLLSSENGGLKNNATDRKHVSDIMNVFETEKSCPDSQAVAGPQSGSMGGSKGQENDAQKVVDKPKTGGRTIIPRKTQSHSVSPTSDRKKPVNASEPTFKNSGDAKRGESRPIGLKCDIGKASTALHDATNKMDVTSTHETRNNVGNGIKSVYPPRTTKDSSDMSRKGENLKTSADRDSKNDNSSYRRHSADLLSSKSNRKEPATVLRECKPDPQSPESVELHGKLFGPLSDFQKRYRRKSADDILDDISRSSASKHAITPEKPKRKIREKTNESPFQVNLKPVPRKNMNQNNEEPMDVDTAPKLVQKTDPPKSILKNRDRSKSVGVSDEGQVQSRGILKKQSVPEAQPMDTTPSPNRPKSILKKTSDSPNSGGFIGLIKRTWTRSMENLTSPMSTKSEGDTSPRMKLSVEFDKSCNKNGSVPVNNMSAFNLMDSVDLARSSTLDKRLETSSESQDMRKKAWQMDSNKTQQPDRRKGVVTPPSTTGTESKPDWMLEAERRKEMRRKSGYEDPEQKKAPIVSPRDVILEEKASEKNIHVNITKPQVAESRRVDDKPIKSNKDHANKAQIVNDRDVRTTEGEGAKPEWMVEAERRKAARKGVFVDPELQQRQGPQSSKVMGNDVPSNGKSTSPRSPRDPVSPTSKPFVNAEMNRIPKKPESPMPQQPSRLIEGDLDKSSLEVTQKDLAKAKVLRKPNRPPPPRPMSPPQVQEPAKKKILPDESFNFSIDSTASDVPPLPPRSPIPSAGYSPELPPRRYRDESTMERQGLSNMIGRPLPSPPADPFPPPSYTPEPVEPTRRKVNAEEYIPEMSILEQLHQIGMQLDHLEGQGRILEEKIRSETTEDEAMDDGDLMVMWFELINKKNELVRADADLMYRQKQQELESQHEDTEYELRCLMAIPPEEKSTSEKIREEALLQQLLETVSLRNSIVDNMEEDRLRYIEEDQEIADMMFAKGFSKEEPPAVVPEKEKKKSKATKDKKKGKKKKHSK